MICDTCFIFLLGMRTNIKSLYHTLTATYQKIGFQQADNTQRHDVSGCMIAHRPTQARFFLSILHGLTWKITAEFAQFWTVS